MNLLRVSLGISYGLGFPVFAFFAPSFAADAGPLWAVVFLSGPLTFVAGHIQLHRRQRMGQTLLSIGAALSQIWTVMSVFVLPPLALGPLAMVVAAVTAWRTNLNPESPMPALVQYEDGP